MSLPDFYDPSSPEFQKFLQALRNPEVHRAVHTYSDVNSDDPIHHYKGFQHYKIPTHEVIKREIEYGTALFYRDRFVAAGGAENLVLTHLPMQYSEHVYLNGLQQDEGTDWTRTDLTLKEIAVQAAMASVAGDIIDVRYAYKIPYVGIIPPSAPDPVATNPYPHIVGKVWLAEAVDGNTSKWFWWANVVNYVPNPGVYALDWQLREILYGYETATTNALPVGGIYGPTIYGGNAIHPWHGNAGRQPEGLKLSIAYGSTGYTVIDAAYPGWRTSPYWPAGAVVHDIPLIDSVDPALFYYGGNSAPPAGFDGTGI